MERVNRKRGCSPSTLKTRSAMKNTDTLLDIRNKATFQEKIDELTDDLLTVLEGHMEEFESEELFFHSIRFLTMSLYETMENHQQAFKVLKLAMDAGIKTYVENKGH
jgi:DNA polymerase III delta prime subunit